METPFIKRSNYTLLTQTYQDSDHNHNHNHNFNDNMQRQSSVSSSFADDQSSYSGDNNYVHMSDDHDVNVNGGEYYGSLKSWAKQTEESYQLQLALALRLSLEASCSDDPNLLDHVSDDDQTLMLRVVGESAESLSHRFWANGCLSYSDKIPDGFYFIHGMDPYIWTVCSNPQESGRIPSLESLKAVNSEIESPFEVIIIDQHIDPNLRELQNHILNISRSSVTTTDVEQLAKLVCYQMGGAAPGGENELVPLWKECSDGLKEERGSVALPIGHLSVGLCRHRALLFKVLADTINLPCRVAKGCRHCRRDDASSCLVRSGINKERLVDLVGNPGFLYEPDSLINGPSSISIYSPLRFPRSRHINSTVNFESIAKQYFVDCDSLNVVFEDPSTDMNMAIPVNNNEGQPRDPQRLNAFNPQNNIGPTRMIENAPLQHVALDVDVFDIPWNDIVLKEKIGEGSFGTVCRADWNGEDVVVKTLSLEQDFHPEKFHEFWREVAIMRRLQHPNIVLFMGVVTQPPNMSIVTEYLPSLNWKVLEWPRNWQDLETTRQLWEEVKDLKDAIFVVDLARDNSIFYNPAISSELGGYIHIHDIMDKEIYSYQLNNKTISPTPVPSLMPPTSRMSMWECRLEDDHREAKFIVESKQEKDEIVGILITDNEVDVSESRLLDSPFDVLELIMKFCVGVEYLNFRATCKRCHQAAPLAQWHNQTALKGLQNYSIVSPWLMVVDQIRGIITFTDPMMGVNYFMRSSQLSIADETICCSRFGWLLFKTSERCAAFFNPFTNDLRELPRPRYYVSTYYFSDPPTSPDCMVVGFSNEHILIHYVAREPTSWHLFDLVTNSQLRPICFPTFHDKDLYALYKTGELMVFKDLGEEDISWEIFKTEAPRSCSESPAQYFLVKCDQHLLLVVMGGFGEPIEVFKLNYSTREWEKVNGVGKHMIYICDTTCLCIEAKTPEMENKIYLAQLSSETKKIVFYSLETCTFHTFDGKSIQEKLGDVFTTLYLSAHTWIEPSWSVHYLNPKEEVVE